jgi:hypothetical protein
VNVGVENPEPTPTYCTSPVAVPMVVQLPGRWTSIKVLNVGIARTSAGPAAIKI